MASDVIPGQIPVTTGLVHGSQTLKINIPQSGGKTLPASGNVTTVASGVPASGNVAAAASSATASAVATSAGATSTAGSGKGTAAATAALEASNTAKKATPSRATDAPTLAKSLNKFLNDSGRADQFRLDPTSNSRIQQINPANGEVLQEFSVDQFPALARSIGASGLLVDDVA